MKTGILLMNTGTPDDCTVAAIRDYLGEFLMDPAIIGAPQFIRKRIVAHICKKRPLRTIKNYEAFWTDDGSPFLNASYKQCDRLTLELSGRIAEPSQVALGMRYGNPSIRSALDELRDGGCDTVVLLPAYPQYVNVCAGTCLKEAQDCLEAMAVDGWMPQVFEVPSFYMQPDYANALVSSVNKAWQYAPGAKLLVSFHSTMMADIDAGDPYKDQTEQTRQLLAQGLDIPDEDVLLSYQSRFDSRKWLQPFTEATAKKLADDGVKDLCVVCPGFTAENIETAIEIDRDLRKSFLDAAGKGASFTYVPALNANGKLMRAMGNAVVDAIAGKTAAADLSTVGSDTSVPGMLSRK